MTFDSDLEYPGSISCHLTGTEMRHTQHMLWIGAIFGALFGWIGILVAALFWVTLAIFKLIGAVIVFGFQLLLWTGAFIAKAIEYAVNRQSSAPRASPETTTPKRTREKR